MDCLPAGPTASPMGLKAVDVRTDEVSDERAEVMSGEDPGGRRPKPENTPGEIPAGGAGPGPAALGVRSRAPRELDSEAAGLSGC